MLSRMALQLLLLLLGSVSPTCRMGSLYMRSCVSSGTAVLTFDDIPHCVAAVLSCRTLFCKEKNYFSICLIKSRRKKSHLCVVRFTKEGLSADTEKFSCSLHPCPDNVFHIWGHPLPLSHFQVPVQVSVCEQ